MKRSPMRRTNGFTKPRRRPNAVSSQQRAKVAARKAPHAEQLRRYPYCEAERMGMPHRCFGGLTVHEPWTRARGGPIDDLRNMVTICAEGNRLVSQDAECMAWAEAHGMLVSAAAGPSWIDAGGFRRGEA